MLLPGQISEGQQLIDRLREEGIPVTAAAWVNETDGDRWDLYLVTPLAKKEEGKGPVYRRIREVIQAMPESVWIGPFQVMVVGPSEMVGRALLDVQRRRLGGRAGWYDGGNLGMMS